MALKRSGFDRPAPRHPSEQLDPPGFDHLLWTWHLKGAKNLDDLPKDLRPKIMGLFSRGDDPLAAFKRARTKPEIEEGEALEVRHGLGDFDDRRAHFRACLRPFDKTKRVVICEALAEIKYRVLGWKLGNQADSFRGEANPVAFQRPKTSSNRTHCPFRA